MAGNGVDESRVAADDEPEVLTPDRQAFRVEQEAPNGARGSIRTEDDLAQHTASGTGEQLFFLATGPRPGSRRRNPAWPDRPLRDSRDHRSHGIRPRPPAIRAGCRRWSGPGACGLPA